MHASPSARNSAVLISAFSVHSASRLFWSCQTLSAVWHTQWIRLLLLIWWFVNRPDMTFATVSAGSPSCGGEVVVYVKDINQLSLPTPFLYSVLVSISVFMTLSTVFHSINSPDNFPFYHSVLAVLSLPCWSFQLYISLRKSPSALI